LIVKTEKKMRSKKHHSILTLFLIFSLFANLLNVQSVRADDETPTEPPPTQVATEPPVEETPISVESTPAPIEASATPVAEILTQVPEGTEVIVQDQSGSAIPLVTQEAAEIVEVNDPMWCPAGVLPGGAGCSASYATISALVSNMVSNTGAYTQNGTIYFTATADASLTLTTATLTGGDFSTLSAYNLTLQGGWNGNTVSPIISGQTSFSGNSINIGTSVNPWIGNITLNDFTFNGTANQIPINVYTSTGNITLSNVDVTNQQNNVNSAQLTSTSGDITVLNGSTFDGDISNQSKGLSATTGSGSITISDTVFSDSIRNGNNTYNGAVLNAPTVTLNNVTATGNDGDGIVINNANIVTLNNVTASNNGTESGPGGLAGNDGSGVLINGNSGSTVIINGGTFNNNQEYGVQVGDPAITSIYIQSPPTCTGNDSNAAPTSSCYNDTINVDTTAPSITPIVAGTAGSNGWYKSNVNVSWSVTDAETGILTSSGCSPSNLTTETSGTTLTCSATNKAGLSSLASVTIKIDKTNPIITFVSRTLANGNGWNNTNVTVNWSCADAFSGIVSANINQTLTTEGASQSTMGTCLDNAGNTASDTQAGINIDKTAPTLTLPTDIITEASGPTGAIVNYLAKAADTLDAFVFAVCSPSSGSTFGLGTTSVNCSSTDAADNTSTGGFQVTVNDTTGPVIAGHSDETVEATGAAGAIVSYSSPATSDAVDGPGTASCLPASGSGFSLGNTLVTCNATDSNGNAAASTTFTIHVVDTTGPALNLPANITADATGTSGRVVTYFASATDLVDGPVAVICSPASGSTFPLGPTVVNCSATDSHSNSSSGSFMINIQDQDSPTITLPANITREATGPSGVVVNYSATASDAVDGPRPVTCSPASGSTFGLGTTTVNCSASDLSGHTTNAAFLVTVRDTTAPTIAFHADITVFTYSTVGVIVNFTNPSASDIVAGNKSASCSPTSGALFQIGDTQVVCTAVDDHGNFAFPGTFFIHVVKLVDPDPPPTPGTSPPNTSTTPGLIIPLTGGELIDLGCLTTLNLFEVKVTFYNLCGHQATITEATADTLPGELPQGYTLIKGLDVLVLEQGQIVKSLPVGTGVQMDFPAADEGQDHFTMLYWNDENGDGQGEWVEISKIIKSEKVSQVLSADPLDELYHITLEVSEVGLYKILTTEKSGVFVLVKR
jgi:hypothetical protein